VSTLVRCSSIGVWDLVGPGVEFAEEVAWSLCCQQYKLSSLEFTTLLVVVAIGRRHGRPLKVTPLHVVETFFESDRPSRDSGVFAKNGIAEWAVN
jgi:hypothetical protein